MNRKIRVILGLIVFLSFFIINNIVKAANFDVWAGAPILFTVGRAEIVNIYAQNKELDREDSYNITYTKIAYNNQGQVVSHLVSISRPYYRIKTLKTNETGDTFATITILGPIRDGSVTFTVKSDFDGTSHDVTVNLMTGSPIILSEFDFSGLIQILLIIMFILVVSYTSHLG
jgi:hypothetical protein